MNVNDKQVMMNLQGDRVLVVVDTDEFIYTIVHLVDLKERKLLLVNRSAKNSEALELTQAVLDNLQPIKHKEAQWQLNL